MKTTTFHTYPDLLGDGGRLAATCWGGSCMAAAVAWRLYREEDAIVLQVSNGADRLVGLAPGGLAA